MKHKQYQSHTERKRRRAWTFFLERHNCTDTSLNYNHDICAQHSSSLLFFFFFLKTEGERFELKEKRIRQSKGSHSVIMREKIIHSNSQCKIQKKPVTEAERGLYSNVSRPQKNISPPKTKTMNCSSKPGVKAMDGHKPPPSLDTYTRTYLGQCRCIIFSMQLQLKPKAPLWLRWHRHPESWCNPTRPDSLGLQ